MSLPIHCMPSAAWAIISSRFTISRKACRTFTSLNGLTSVRIVKGIHDPVLASRSAMPAPSATFRCAPVTIWQ